MSVDQAAVVLITFMGAIIGATGAFFLFRWLYQEYSYPPLWKLLIEAAARGHILEKPSNTSTIRRRLGTLITRAKDLDLIKRRARAAHSLTLGFCREDIAELKRHGSFEDLPVMVAEAYVTAALHQGWADPPSESLTVYVIVDETARPNFPTVRTGAPIGARISGIVVPIHPEDWTWPPAAVATVSHDDDDDRAASGTVSSEEGNSGAAVSILKKHPVADNDPEKTRPIRRIGTILVDGNAAQVLTELGLTIGRERSCDLFIDHPSVSRLHARLTIHGDDIVLAPELSRYCYVNSVLIKGPTILRTNDVMTFGDCHRAFALTLPAA